MRSPVRNLILILIISASLTTCIPTIWGQKSIYGTQDISVLLKAAENRFDLSKEDAVILFDGKKIYWLDDGRLVTYVHRIIWINTEIAKGKYGDHRIRYDGTHCNFNVTTVRTWRDGQWWETGPTGIVETLPFELEKAYDYTNMREMMLLHNGIELPCILEIAYSIEDKEPFRRGAEGLWTFTREEPAVLSWFTYGLPAGKNPNVFTSKDVPRPEKYADEEPGLDIYRWMMGPLDAIPRPHTDDPVANISHIAWSTWENWREYGNYLNELFKAATKLDEPLKRSLDSLIADARTDTEKADLIAEFINKVTRFIYYPEHYWWPSVRLASRIYATAYGHRLDRAILAAALFKEAGIETHPVFLGKGYGQVDEGVPSLSRMAGIGVWVSGDNLEAYYDPASGIVSNGSARIYNRTVWSPGFEDKPIVRINDDNKQSLIEVRIDLAFDTKKDCFNGTGYFYADNCFNPYDRMEGLAKESITCLGSVVSSLIKGAEVTGFNPSVFNRSRVVLGFELELKKPEPDYLGRLQIVIGEPSGGIYDHLPGDVHLYHQTRSSRINLPCLMNQIVELRLDLKGLDIIYHATDQTAENGAGSFSIKTNQKDSKIVITRKLNLTKTIYQPEEWSILRTLLLADSHEKNQTLLLKTTKNAKDNQSKKGSAKKQN
jgi:hypothetical protein